MSGGVKRINHLSPCSLFKDEDGTVIDNEADMAAAFNSYFSKYSKQTKVDKMNSELVKERLGAYVQGKLQTSPQKSFSVPAVTSDYVLQQLHKLGAK